MAYTSDQIMRDLVNEAARSPLPPADRAKALAAAATRIRTMASADPVDVLTNELVASAFRSTPGPAAETRTFLAELAEGVDIAAIEIEGRLRGDERETRKASLRLSIGEDYDLSDISNEGARPFVDRMLEEIGDIAPGPVRVGMVNALLRSIDRLPRDTVLGSDEMYAGLLHHLAALIPVRDMDPTATRRTTAMMRDLIQGGL
jgi:hypothetical protein